VTPLTVTPPPDMVTVEVPVRLVPVRVTATTLPRAPELGEIEVSVGVPPPVPPPPEPMNSTAPTSTAFGLLGSGLGLPKKSVVGKPSAEPMGTKSMAGEPAASA
jgi:hypothetical protein